MSDRAAILRKAWAAYRNQSEAAARHRARTGQPALPFSRKLFSQYLRSEWRNAKATAAYIARCEAEVSVPEPVKAIRSQLLSMELSDAPINWERHRALSIDLFRASLTA